MNRGTFNRGALDLLVGMICGVLMYLGPVFYLTALGIAVVGVLVIIINGGNVSAYGNDSKGNFNGQILLIRIVVVNVGVFLGKFAMSTAF